MYEVHGCNLNTVVQGCVGNKMWISLHIPYGDNKHIGLNLIGKSKNRTGNNEQI